MCSLNNIPRQCFGIKNHHDHYHHDHHQQQCLSECHHYHLYDKIFIFNLITTLNLEVVGHEILPSYLVIGNTNFLNQGNKKSRQKNWESWQQKF